MQDQGLLLINLGSPRSTEVSDVRQYLNQFLMDPYVIDLPWPLRRALVSLILLRRPSESAEAYRQIWWEEGSPLIVISQRLCNAVRPLWKHGPVELGMRYAAPSIENALLALAEQGARSVLVAPLYPQFADSTTTTAIEEVRRVINKHKLSLQLRTLPPFHAEPDYIQALVASARPALEQDFHHLLFSFHGLPERYLIKRDPGKNHCLQSSDCCHRATGEVLKTCYKAQCIQSAAEFAANAGLKPEQWSVAFQSRLGRAKWIEPYTESRLDELAQQGVRKLLVMSPAFVADCIETYEELGIRGRVQFIAAGGEDLQLIPCLNDNHDWAQALVRLCEAQLGATATQISGVQVAG
ncbi:ferrochelatase [Halopseudomonas xiamenensis]|uniref:ferrochelatase n=1 Tax=Halopseudomonas xiamenensis TaxID=157792 RepID=UPI001629F46F|nr:ferrochelatase [Halopseudomonas xiamenensis]